MLTMLKATDHRVMPWANGGGKTTEIALWPPHATLAARDFDWRISIAHVSEDGPFSKLDGYDRILTVITGNGITLDAGEHGVFPLNGLWQQARFRGDWALDGRLVDGAIDDLNVMVSRDRCQASVDILTLDPAGEPTAIAAHAASMALIVLQGVVTVDPAGGDLLAMGMRDALVGSDTPAITLRGEDKAVVAVVRFTAV